MSNILRDVMPSLHDALLGNLADSVVYSRNTTSKTISAVPSVPEQDRLATAKAKVFGVRVADCPVTPARGDTITYAAKTYRVVDFDFNDYGWARLFCEEVK